MSRLIEPIALQHKPTLLVRTLRVLAISGVTLVLGSLLIGAIVAVSSL